VTAHANLEQERYWNTDGGPRWVELGRYLDRQLENMGTTALEAGRPAPGEAVLDVGCGAGATSVLLAVAVAPGGRVVGVDISEPLLAQARTRDVAAIEASVSFRRADAQDADWGEDRFDLVYSRFGVMFFADPPAAFANLRAATRPGGRLAFVCWQKPAANEWSAVPARAALPLLPPAPPPDPLAPGPFAFADPDRVRTILSTGGWADIDVAPVQTTIQLGGTADFDEAVHVSVNVGPMGRAMLGLPEDQRPAVLDAIRNALRPFHVEGEGCRMGAAFWLVTAVNPS
jgi:SAM-dependent methyltransferase